MTRLAAIGGGTFGRPYRAATEDGREFFVKVGTGEAEGMLRHEADGLRWLANATSGGGADVADVVAVQGGLLVLDWIAAAPASPSAAQDFGRRLGLTHRAGADRFGTVRDGFIASEPLPGGVADDWPSFYAESRLQPFLDRARTAGRIEDADGEAVERVIEQLERLAGPPERPARLHGDLWSGNVIWTGSSAVLIDPSAHGGHRESDLAMLALFGLPLLETVLSAYDAEFPLAPGWRSRMSLHQLYPLLVHTVLFGGHYGRSVGSAARRALQHGDRAPT